MKMKLFWPITYIPKKWLIPLKKTRMPASYLMPEMFEKSPLLQK